MIRFVVSLSLSLYSFRPTSLLSFGACSCLWEEGCERADTMGQDEVGAYGFEGRLCEFVFGRGFGGFVERCHASSCEEEAGRFVFSRPDETTEVRLQHGEH